jgi:light-regulated signal transduction histidine kinase (bacteriophytochrome)
MKKLIQDLLEFSRISSKKGISESINCNEITDNVLTIFQVTIKELNAEINVMPLPTIIGVRPQIQQLFQNLIGNALKYHSEKPVSIAVGCKEHDAEWEFFIKDNGIGIQPKFFDKIFIIFQRLHDISEVSGTGIGLAICKKIVEKHNGRIWVESEPGSGSTFYFTISKINIDG